MQNFPNYICKIFEKKLFLEGVNLVETLKNLNDLHWLEKRILESSDSETYLVKNKKKSKKGSQSTKENY